MGDEGPYCLHYRASIVIRIYDLRQKGGAQKVPLGDGRGTFDLSCLFEGF